MGVDAGVALAVFVRVEQTAQQKYGLAAFNFLKVLVLQCAPSS